MSRQRPSGQPPQKPLPSAVAAGRSVPAAPGRLQRLLLDGVAHHRAGRLDAAAGCYRAVLEAAPRTADACHLLAAVAHQQGNHAAAVDLARRAIRVDPKNAAYRNTLGAALLGLGRAEEAVAAFRLALGRQPAYPEALNNLGNALMRLHRREEAIAAYRAALAARPDYPQAHNNLAGALREQGDLRAAEASYRAALSADPGYASALANLARVLHEQGRYEAALAACDEALALAPDHPEARGNRAVVLLTLGRFAEGWGDYEARWRVDGFTTPRRTFDRPAWDGSDLAGRTLLLHAEQGLGSAIQFARYAPLIAERFQGSVVLEAQVPLRRLFATLPGAGGRVTVIERGAPPPAFDVHAPLLSAPGLTGTDAQSIPAQVPYLAADPADLAAWRERFGGDGLRLGVVWSGNPAHANDRNRSMPAAALAPLADVPGVRLFSLQVGGPMADIAAFPPGAIVDLAPDLSDFAVTAAALSHLDLVVSVDTAVAHLAGALARPVWLLVPFIPEWRWQLERPDSPWYPTMRLFRQASPGDWTGVVRRVVAALLETGAVAGGGGR